MSDKHLKLLNGESQRGPDIGHLIDRAFWAILSLLVWIGVDHLKDLSKSVGELNQKVAVVIEQVASHERRIDVLEDVSRRLGAGNK